MSLLTNVTQSQHNCVFQVGVLINGLYPLQVISTQMPIALKFLLGLSKVKRLYNKARGLLSDYPPSEYWSAVLSVIFRKTKAKFSEFYA